MAESSTMNTPSTKEDRRTENLKSGMGESGQRSQGRRSDSGSGSRLTTESGNTSIADNVVSKIAGLAAREIPGVQSMGGGMARRMGQLRSLVPGGNQTLDQGVSVEVGEREAAVDLDIVTWYGQSIVEVAEAVRSNVINRIEAMTGLKVVEVNINVDDVYVEGDDDGEKKKSGNGNGSDKESRVQ
ncbi:putative alkaline shock family protein YloU [Stackebrandtia albiflava]|uniref:Putative alkaline shock family protein YloU n=1 Tax=Stackebrandtia albiflava TaxID=406432 RepID=A0A562UXP1_9ACTN|nr:Asp23/Gls24 family envelope stress response protein [Stackebrandtia albiflava]TWJ10430.1 putative alkaline shock family protein YloU [Stackebrandtia albiflava]